MKSKIVLLLLYSLLCQRVKSLSPEEDLEIEEELKRLNKPANQDNSDGVWRHYDCVDFYKQPAFDHPLLKNHSFHFGFFVLREGGTKKDLSARGINSATIKRLDCPTGTIPIRRTSKEELIAAKMQAKVHAQHSDPNTVDVHGLHLAIVRTEFGPLKKYNGGGMFSSVEVPKASGAQYSAGQMKIENIPDFIQAGWMVNPSLYSDNQTRGFIFQKAMADLLQMGNSSCFNVQCPGFILVRSNHPVDAIFEAHSHRGGPVYTYNYFIYRDPTSGLWWLQLGEDSIVVGFRPKKIFSGPGFQDLATYLEWGGQTYSPPEVKSPPMGRGDFLTSDVKLTASCQDITTITEAHEGVPPADTQAYSDREKYHWALDRGYLKGPLKHVMLFGSPSGATGWA
ncbi:hypothetical protein BT93_L3900 [Corymbia citriodora subsp. variegata]|uniref:Neprosin PEP catalytic domain-containing protein n=1 Tax=Corymbia citriodora subsp. variegata TaxID=360336 RepID=A0A8T0CGH1_CORYI|nr:hypothetical protein BT93_L3900 [Corymbia citriodora subsp. variegata]